MRSRFRDAFPILQVSDVPRSIAFYRERLGFELLYAFPSEDDPQFASLSVAGGKLGLGKSGGVMDTSSTSLWLYTDDVDAAVEELRAAGVPVREEPADQPWGERVAAVADPDGYVVHLGARAADAERGTGGELAFFEIGVQDPDRGRAFYEALFAWAFEPGPTGEGWAISTPNLPGGMHGGDPGAAPYVFFAVDDMEAALARVRELGGEVEEMNVEGSEESIARFGRFKLCRDDQGSRFGLHQPPAG